MNRSELALLGVGFAAGALSVIIVELLAGRLDFKSTATQVTAAIASPPQTAVPSSAAAEPFADERRACTLKAAERLPKIPGLAIKQTRTKI